MSIYKLTFGKKIFRVNYNKDDIFANNMFRQLNAFADSVESEVIKGSGSIPICALEIPYFLYFFETFVESVPKIISKKLDISREFAFLYFDYGKNERYIRFTIDRMFFPSIEPKYLNEILDSVDFSNSGKQLFEEMVYEIV